MQCFNLTKEIEFEYKIEDLLLFSIDDELDIIDDKDGIKITGEIIIGGNAKTSDGNKEFSDSLHVDIYLDYDSIEERNSLGVSVNDFNYVIKDNTLNINIALKIEGLKEIETTFLSQEDTEFFEEEIEEERVYESEEVIEESEVEVEENIDKTFIEEIVDLQNESKKSLLKSVFSNKRIKEEVSWKLHCVKEETSYEQIAQKYNVDLKKLVLLNKNEKIEEGKLIFLPIE